MATRVFAANGNDSTGTGSQANPYKTMVKAWRSSGNSDEILYRTPGVWDGVNALFHTQAQPGDAVPNYGSTNHAPTGVTIRIDPDTPTGVAEFKIPTLTGWGKNEQGGNPLAPLVAGHIIELINPGRLFWDGGDRTLVYDYETAGNQYPSEGIKEGFSSAIYLIRKSGLAGLQGAHNSTIKGVSVGQYAGMGFHANLVQGCHFVDCVSASMGVNGGTVGTGTVSGFRFNSNDGSRANTTMAVPSARLATSITVASTTGMAVGDPIVIGNGRNREVRKITAISGNDILLGGWLYPRGTIGDVMLDELPLLYPHAVGEEVITQFGTENCTSKNNGRMGKNTAGGNDDFGCEGFVFQKGAQKILSYHDVGFGNWAREGSLDYSTEGGWYTFYAAATNSKIVINKAWGYDNHSAFEMGRDRGTWPGARDNGGWLISECVIDGLSDYHHLGVPPKSAGASISLLRSNPNGIFRKLTVVTSNGGPSGGFRWLWQDPVNSYGGPIDNVEITEVIFVPKYQTLMYRFDASVATQYGSFPPGTKINRNLFTRLVGTGDAAIADFGSNRVHAHSEAGRQSWRNKSLSHGFDFSENDKWAVDANTLFVNRVGRDYRLAQNSPAKGMAEYGDDIGAIAQVIETTKRTRIPVLGYRVFD
jgi:hypothetical protein